MYSTFILYAKPNINVVMISTFQNIILTICDLSIQQSDYLYVYDGGDTSASQIVKKKKNNIPPAVIGSVNNTLLVRFYSDYDHGRDYNGVQFMWEMLDSHCKFLLCYK